MTARVSRCLKVNGSPVDVAAKQPRAAKQEVAREGDEALGNQGVEIVGPGEALKIHALHQILGDDPGGRYGREGRRVGSVRQHQGHEKSTDPQIPGNTQGDRRQQGCRRDVARADAGQDGGQEKEDNGDHTPVAPGETNRIMCQLVQSPVLSRLREEKGDAGQREEQLHRKAGRNRGDFHSGQEVTRDEGQRDGEDSDIDGRETADDQRQQQGKKRQNSWIHFRQLPKKLSVAELSG